MERKSPKVNLPPGGWSSAKRATSIELAPATRTPVATPADGVDVLGRTLVWRFTGADHEGSWPVGGLAADDLLAEVLVKMGNFESMTVRELFHSGGHPGKLYDVPELPEPARARLVEINRDDETRIARLRLTGPQRLYGFLREHVFHVLWWDPQHQVFPSKKKHT